MRWARSGSTLRHPRPRPWRRRSPRAARVLHQHTNLRFHGAGPHSEEGGAAAAEAAEVAVVAAAAAGPRAAAP